MSNILVSVELTADAFAPFGDVIEARGSPTSVINGGRCGRYHDLANLDFHESGRAGINIFQSQPIALPFQLRLVERHPLGSQAFVPISGGDYLIVVAEDEAGVPVRLKAFHGERNQGVNYRRGIWHGVLMPIEKAALFTVVDWIGDRQNLEEFHFKEPITITAQTS